MRLVGDARHFSRLSTRYAQGASDHPLQASRSAALICATAYVVTGDNFENRDLKGGNFRARSEIANLLIPRVPLLTKPASMTERSTNCIGAAAGSASVRCTPTSRARRRRWQRLLTAIPNKVSEMTRRALGRAPIEVAAREFVGLRSRLIGLNPELHGLLAEQISCVGRLENIQANVREGYALVPGYLEAHRGEIDVADLDLGP